MSEIIMRTRKAADGLPTLTIDGETVAGAVLDLTVETKTIEQPTIVYGDPPAIWRSCAPGVATYGLYVGEREILRTTIKPAYTETDQEYFYTWQARKYDVTCIGDVERHYIYKAYKREKGSAV